MVIVPPRTGVRLEKHLVDEVARASRDFAMLAEGDRILCALSGGKDSYAMIWLLREIRRKAPFDFELVAVNLDQGHPGFPQHVIREWCEAEGFEHRMLHRDTYSVVLEKIPEGKTYCSLCSRLRRGILYDAAVELGCNKIALGHHRDDVLETLFLNLMFAGQLKAMPPKLFSDDGRNIVIRPLISCAEEDLARLAEEKHFPVVPCDLCGSQENLQRKQIKRLLTELSEKNPRMKSSMLAALGNVRPTHLLDRGLWERLGLDRLVGTDDAVP
ncbi:MAG: tRNA 2-thiocytidine(32) synthetase TtcA [Myxococcales bacterium]|nr:tRNA 2-thiocytidine(32) synthetase TtcA [Myxococcales bacterium]